MSFQGFSRQDFDTFTIEGLEPRMEAIRERIQPKFQQLGLALGGEISIMAGHDMFLHIAKHARRKTNAPKDTWLAFSANKRGYKQHPHFQIGLFDDHVFLWYALIYELPDKQAIARKYAKNIRLLQSILPADYVLSMDHMKKENLRVGELSKKQWASVLDKFEHVKKAELLIGKHFANDDPLLQDGPRFVQTAKAAFETLMPLYHLALEA